MSLAYNVGYNARLYGNASVKTCPYMKGSFLYNDWWYGWNLCDEQMQSAAHPACFTHAQQMKKKG